MTEGDGGNHEGLAATWIDPQPEWSAFRESSYGHGELTVSTPMPRVGFRLVSEWLQPFSPHQVLNATHLYWEWHRNDDGEPEVSEALYIPSKATASCK